MRSILPACFAALLSVVAWAVPAASEDNPAVVETLEILRDRGMIDDAKYAELVAKNQAWEAARPSLLSRIEWSGDFRGRLENFWYQKDDFPGSESTPDRSRGRYRLRIGARAKVNEVATAGFRLASGQDDWRSTNTTYGDNPNFGPDSIFIDQAYLELAVPKRFLPETMTVKSIVGKQANPFLWKQTRDLMVWDQDISPAGLALQVAGAPMEGVSLFGNAGYLIADENGGSRDPHVLGIQGGVGFVPTEGFELGARASWYDWGSLNTAFLDSSADFGSLITNPSDYQVAELATYVRNTSIENLPILVYGHIAQNLEASSPAGDQDLGWGAGVEIGDKKKLALLGGGYYYLEANFSPSQFTDSDLFDGYTNRKGFLVYLTREVFANTDMTVTFFSGDAIEDGAAFDIGAVTGEDTPSADRYRLQTDISVKF